MMVVSPQTHKLGLACVGMKFDIADFYVTTELASCRALTCFT